MNLITRLRKVVDEIDAERFWVDGEYREEITSRIEKIINEHGHSRHDAEKAKYASPIMCCATMCRVRVAAEI